MKRRTLLQSIAGLAALATVAPGDVAQPAAEKPARTHEQQVNAIYLRRGIIYQGSLPYSAPLAEHEALAAEIARRNERTIAAFGRELFGA